MSRLGCPYVRTGGVGLDAFRTEDAGFPGLAGCPG